jgi:hypothetical protein
MGGTPVSSCGAIFAFHHRSQYAVASLWAPPTEAIMVHTPVDMKTGMDGALALIDELKAMLVKTVAVEEAKRAALLAALPQSPSLVVFRSPLPSYPPLRQAIFKRRCITSLG